jgi:hypothetical protein
MSPFVRAALAALTFAALAFAAPTPTARAAAPVPPDGGKALTFPFPAKAPVVVQVNGIGTVRDRFAAMLKGALPDDAPAVTKQLDDGLKQLLADRKLTAVPKEGRVFLVVNNIESLIENTPAISVLVPVTSYKEFRESFLTTDERKTFEAGKNGADEVKMSFLGEHTVYMVDLREYVALTPDKGTAETYSNKYARATTAAMPPELAKSFVAADLALYVNLDVINDAYGDQIRAIKGLVDFGIQQAAMGGMLPGINKKQVETAKVLLQGAFQAIEDCRGLVLAVEFRPEGLNIRLQGQFAENTTSAKLLGAEVPATLADVGKLPTGWGQYGGSKFGKKFDEVIHGLNPEFAAADDDEKGNELLEKRLSELRAAGPRGEISGSGAPDVTLSVARFADPEKAAKALAGSYAAMSAGGRVQGIVLKEPPRVTAGARKHAGFTFTQVTLIFDFDATVKDLPEGLKESTLAQLKRTVSKNAYAWVGTDGKTVVRLQAEKWDAAGAALDQFLDGKQPVSETAGYKLTRKNLPQEASLLLLLETGQTITALLDMTRALEGNVPGFPKIGQVKAPKGEPSFVGVAVTLKGDTATANLFVPGSAIATSRKMLTDLFKSID